MKLRNKKTGEIIDLDYVGNIKAQFGGISVIPDTAKLGGDEYVYDSLEALTDEWEDVPVEKYWYIDDEGSVEYTPNDDDEGAAKNKAIGNYFESEEEAKQAVEKLKAWQRLKDDRFKFEGWYYDVEPLRNGRLNIQIRATLDENDNAKLSDLDLIFGGEE